MLSVIREGLEEAIEEEEMCAAVCRCVPLCAAVCRFVLRMYCLCALCAVCVLCCCCVCCDCAAVCAVRCLCVRALSVL